MNLFAFTYLFEPKVTVALSIAGFVGICIVSLIVKIVIDARWFSKETREELEEDRAP